MIGSRSLPETTDVLVIGGGPAGLAAAIAARQRGLNVVVADGGRTPIDKACGEGLLPDGVAALGALGVQVSVSETRAFRGIRFLSRGRSADAPFNGRRYGLAIRRTSLHRAMAERAQELGAELMWEMPVGGIPPAGAQVGTRFLRARWIVGADGFHSRVRRWAGLEQGARPRLRYAFRRHFRIAP